MVGLRAHAVTSTLHQAATDDYKDGDQAMQDTKMLALNLRPKSDFWEWVI